MESVEKLKKHTHEVFVKTAQEQRASACMNRVAAGVGTLGTKSQYSVGPQNHQVFLKCLWSQQNV